jgi:TolA-binding protein
MVAAWKLGAVLLALGGVVGLALWRAPDPVPDPPTAPAVAHVSAPRNGGGPGTMTPPPAPAVAPIAPVAPAAPAAPAVVTDAPASVPPSRPRTPARPAIHAPPVAPTAPEVVPEAAVPEPAAPEAPAVSEPALTATDPDVVEVPAAPVAPPAAAPPPLTPGPSRLAVEVALVDRARSRLGAGDHAAALAALADYHRQFPNGDLDAEADVVTIEVLIAQREPDKARRLGTAFLGRFPRSPLAQRVRSLLDRLPK